MSSTLRYNNDWHSLTESIAITWPEPEFAGCRGLGELLARIPSEPDALLGALLRRCQAGDALAGRVIVQAMLGKLVRMSVRDGQADLDDYVAHLWCVLMRYPIERRPDSVAAGLALDTLKAAVAERPRPEAVLAGLPAEEPRLLDDAVVVLARAERGGLISARESALLRAVYVEGRSSADVGISEQRSAAAVRQACRTAVRRLAEHRDELAA